VREWGQVGVLVALRSVVGVVASSLSFIHIATSGLDSKTALNVMQTIVQLARCGRTVVATIHQPRSNIYDLFDDLLLLTQGQVAYFGPANQAVAYFAELGFECPRHYNPADVCSFKRVQPTRQHAYAQHKCLSITHSK